MAANPGLGNTGTGVPGASDNWWIVTRWNRKQLSMDKSVTQKLNDASLDGRRCVITLEQGPSASLDRCHLVPFSILTKFDKNSQLRYAWGRVLLPNEPWDLLWLRMDIHRAFDAGAWALVPDKDLVHNIRRAIKSEQARRDQEGITGPWKDLGVASWDNQDGFDYTFVPITLQDEDVIITRRDKPMENDPSRLTLTLHYRPYPNFPRLKCHVHPYAVIKDAYPKLEANQDKLPEEILDMMGSLGFIYRAWEKVEQEAASQLHPPSTTTASGTTQTGTVPGGSGAGPSPSQGEEHSSTNNDSEGQGDPTPSGSNSGGQGEHGELFDEDSCSLLSALTSEHSIPCQDDVTALPAPAGSFAEVNAKLSETDQTIRLPKDFYEWNLGVEAARQHNQLVEVIDHSPELEKYATEVARPPPTEDWHRWTSEYSLWYTPLPQDQERGAFSSNDWVIVKNYPPLTRAFDEG